MLHRLLSHQNVNTYEITALVRSEEKAKKLESFGVKSVVGSFEDLALVEKLAADANVVFSCVCSDRFGFTHSNVLSMDPPRHVPTNLTRQKLSSEG